MSVLVFGSTNVDLVMRPTRLPAPGETVLCSSYQMVPGGKGANQALAARRAGAEVTFVSAVGCDANAETALSNLRADDVNLESVKRTEYPTGCAVVLVEESGENAICVASGANRKVSACQVKDEMLASAKILLLQQEVSVEENTTLVTRAKTAGVPVLCNLAPVRQVPDNFLSDVDYLVMNEIEAARLMGTSAAARTPQELAEALANHHHLTAVLTLGGDGVIFTTAGKAHHLHAPVITAVDTTGAGDTFTGYLAAGLAREADLPAALPVAVEAASMACTRTGAQTAIPVAGPRGVLQLKID